jgi:uncharacterized Zn-finger protein
VNRNESIAGIEELRKQYELCEVRGHQATVFSEPTVLCSYGDSTFEANHPAPAYPNIGATGWKVCWHCKTRYRFVTTMEEEGRP